MAVIRLARGFNRNLQKKAHAQPQTPKASPGHTLPNNTVCWLLVGLTTGTALMGVIVWLVIFFSGGNEASLKALSVSSETLVQSSEPPARPPEAASVNRVEQRVAPAAPKPAQPPPAGEGKGAECAPLNTVSENVPKPVTVVPAASEGTSATVSGGLSKMIPGGAVAGAMCYMDRAFRIVSLPQELAGGNLICTSNGDDYSTRKDQMVIGLPVRSRVYVCYCAAATDRPDWLKREGWSRLDSQVAVKIGAADSYYNIFVRSEAPGSLILGGNERKRTGALSMYFVVTRAAE